MQLADRLILQKELNPTAQHQQIILSAKPASPFWNNALIYTRVTIKLMQEDWKGGRRWKETHIECRKFTTNTSHRVFWGNVPKKEEKKNEMDFLVMIAGVFLHALNQQKEAKL